MKLGLERGLAITCGNAVLYKLAAKSNAAAFIPEGLRFDLFRFQKYYCLATNFLSRHDGIVAII